MSNPYYIAFNFSVSPIVPGREILIAQLSSLGFESFVETTNGVEAFGNLNMQSTLRKIYVYVSWKMYALNVESSCLFPKKTCATSMRGDCCRMTFCFFANIHDHCFC